MYWQNLGLAGSPASPAVEDAARWVQWAQAGILDDAKTRYNLDRFWKAKAAAYNSESITGRQQLEKLDVLAHSVWQALEEKKAVTAAPPFLAALASSILGGTPARPAAAAPAAAARTASAGVVAASRRVGAEWGTGFEQYSQTAARSVQATGDAAWKAPGGEFLGVPVWAWLAGAGALAVVFLVKK